ncbi:transcription regulator [Prunus dulcis]|uniref:Transcription regulator n=1 Tax=Prunus dulcis TaxID=3755 RepID=A0A4Y1RK13_PRUDU|nr:transcription regulator [Prunus dulcis]
MGHSKTSIILDASKYIQDLKRKLEQMNQEIIAAARSSSAAQNPFPQLKVEPREGGFLIKLFAERSCSGLLVFILEAFEELGLDVHQARDNQSADQKDAQAVKEAVLQAIQNWSEVTQQE